LQLIGSSPSDDIIFVQGPAGAAFDLHVSPLMVGQDVALAAYPLALEKDLSGKGHVSVPPLVAHGRVVAIAPTNDLVAADYHGAMPNASGGAVLVGKWCAGVHLGTSYHLDTTHEADEEAVEPDQGRWDTDQDAMWKGTRQGAQGKGKRRAVEEPGLTAAADQEKLALHASSNIPHKDQLAVFVPSATIIRLAQNHQLLGLTDMDIVKRKHAVRSQ